ncbi:O-succinylbenzoic acid--CoA ligase [Sinomicrobium oceani]|uniref:O-succinylbenzoic acid--CoA ligase n=1 Tax=Sinomicrobium oceani TaxID=1150368 RepID=A0A1K1MB58_9FLAO|nr:AMP-binding protein [Sinomicrobium oceani]SFW20394.1 O-succinylbenzoic acid--CoA ligase [Sinomicrobium oceani]
MTNTAGLSITYKNIHNRFKLDGNYFSREDLSLVAYNFIKEGEPYQKAIGDFLLDWIDDKDTITAFTSGSTGNPKKIQLEKQSMVNSALATGDFFGISVGDRALLCLPVAYIAGKMMLVRAMILGLEIDLIRPVSAPLEETCNGYDFVAMTPMQVEHSVAALDRIKTLIVGGAPMSGALKAKLTETSCSVYETYGMTETVSHIAAKKITGNDGEAASCFHALPGVGISTDERGCLVIDAPEISGKQVVTNDLVELVAENTFRWLGRYDHVINSGGIKLIPEQIEEKLRSIIPGRFYVSGVKDARLGEKLVLFVEESSNPGWTAEAVEKAIRTLHSLGKYEVPKEIRLEKNFRETQNGKLLRHRDL